MSEAGLKFGSVSHWGAYTTKVEDGRIVGVEPFSKDPNPSPIIEALPSAVHHKSRIARPMVRKGFLDRRENSDRTLRGAEPFVPVSWDEALDLVAHEIERVRSAHGNEAIYGSSGWASAGVFHNAFNQLKRFLNGAGGFVDQGGEPELTRLEDHVEGVSAVEQGGLGAVHLELRTPPRFVGNPIQIIEPPARITPLPHWDPLSLTRERVRERV